MCRIFWWLSNLKLSCKTPYYKTAKKLPLSETSFATILLIDQSTISFMLCIYVYFPLCKPATIFASSEQFIMCLDYYEKWW